MITMSEEEFYRLKAKAGEALDNLSMRDVGPHEHVWRSVGGANAGCCEECACSVAVLECVLCGYCDYGDNEQSRDVIASCEYREEVENG